MADTFDRDKQFAKLRRLREGIIQGRSVKVRQNEKTGEDEYYLGDRVWWGLGSGHKSLSKQEIDNPAKIFLESENEYISYQIAKMRLKWLDKQFKDLVAEGTYIKAAKELFKSTKDIAEQSPESVLGSSWFGVNARVHDKKGKPVQKYDKDGKVIDDGRLRIESTERDRDPSDEHPTSLHEIQRRVNVNKQRRPRLIFQTYYDSVPSAKANLKSSMATNNLMYGFCKSMFGDTMTADISTVRGIYDNKSLYRGRFDNLQDTEEGRRYVSGVSADNPDGNFMEIDNSDLVERINQEIYNHTDKVFGDSAYKNSRSGIGILTDSGENMYNADYGIKKDTKMLEKGLNGVVKNMQNNGQHISVTPEEMSEFIGYAQDFAKASVAPLIAECLKGPIFGKNYNDKVIVINETNGTVGGRGKAINLAQMQLGDLMTNSLNSKRDAAWCNLQGWLSEKGIPAEQFEIERGGQKMKFEQVLNNMSRAYFAGYVQSKPGLSNYLDPEKMESVQPTRLSVGDTSQWAKWQGVCRTPSHDSTIMGPGGSAYVRNIDETGKLHRTKHAAPAEKSLSKKGIPIRALAKLYRFAKDVFKMFVAPIQSIGLLENYLAANYPEYSVTDKGDKVSLLEKQQREKIKTDLNVGLVHAEVTGDLRENGGEDRAEADKYAENLVPLNSDYNKAVNIANGIERDKAFKGVEDGLKTISDQCKDPQINGKDTDSKIDEVIASFAARTKEGNEKFLARGIDEEPNRKMFSSVDAKKLMGLIGNYTNPDAVRSPHQKFEEKQEITILLNKYGQSRMENKIKEIEEREQAGEDAVKARAKMKKERNNTELQLAPELAP